MITNKRLRYVFAALLLASGVAGAAAAFRSAIPMGTASSWSSAVNADPNAVRGPWFNSNEHSLAHTNTGGSGTDWQLDNIVYSVQAFGAIGGGSGDDAAAIQSAIAAAPSGATVYVPAGSYNLIGSGTEILLISKPISFRCAGWGNTRLQIDATVPNTRDVFHVTTPSANIGLSIDDCFISPTLGAAKTITGASNATPIQITTSAAHGYSTGQTVTIGSVGGNTNANGTWVLTVVDGTNFTLNGSVGNAAYTAGGVSQAVPGRHGINLDADAGNILANVRIVHNFIGQLGGRALRTTNTASLANGIFLVDVVDNRFFGGMNLNHAGDSILMRGNTLTGGFNGIDIDSVSGAVQNEIVNNNYTGQGAFVVATHAGGLRITDNNVEPGATGGAGVDTSNNPNSAVIDLQGSVGNPVVLPIVVGNNLTNWSNWTTNGDVVRVDFGLGARIEENDIKRAAAGPFNYKVTVNAVGTQIRIPVGTDSGNYLNQVSNASTTTVTVYENQAAQQLFTTENLTTNKTSNLILSNPTAATAGVTAQNSPFIEFDSNAWNSSALTSQNSDWILGSVPVSVAGTPFGAVSFFSKTAGGGATQQWFVTNAGNMIATANVYTGGAGGVGTIEAAHLNPATASTPVTLCDSANASSCTVGRSTVGLTVAATAFASLPAATNGTMIYCNDCTIANPCAGAGTGAIAKRLNGAWVCN